MILLKTIDKAIARIEGWLIIASVTLMVSLTFLHVILRALYRYANLQWANMLLGTIDWTEILVRLLVLWVTFFGASLLTRDNKHIKIDLMSSILPLKWQPVRELILSLGSMLICILMLKASIDYIKIEISFGGQLFPGFPIWAGQWVIPAGFALILFRFLLRGIEQTLMLFRGQQS